jgi:hypothetical protein
MVGVIVYLVEFIDTPRLTGGVYVYVVYLCHCMYVCDMTRNINMFAVHDNSVPSRVCVPSACIQPHTYVHMHTHITDHSGCCAC